MICIQYMHNRFFYKNCAITGNELELELRYAYRKRKGGLRAVSRATSLGNACQ